MNMLASVAHVRSKVKVKRSSYHCLYVTAMCATVAYNKNEMT